MLDLTHGNSGVVSTDHAADTYYLKHDVAGEVLLGEVIVPPSRRELHLSRGGGHHGRASN